LFEFLKQSGALATYYIPHRLNEGYGLKADQVEKIIEANPGLGLIVTVDCGSHSHDAIDAARQAGVDVVVTDHHNTSDNLPDALAVVNPKRRDCPAGLDHLAGVGVAFYMAIALRKRLRDGGYWRRHSEPNLKNLCDLVALGTVADLVPLTHENRILVKTGLEVLQARPRLGLKFLSKACGFFKHKLDSEDIAFRIAPRLNAAGRIEHAKTAAELLLSDRKDRAAELAKFLDDLNARRRELEKTTYEQVLEQIEKNAGSQGGKPVVLANPEWHEGVLGIVASRVAERFFAPAVLISEKNGFGKGSCRSIPGFDLFEGLCRCAPFLDDFGGHSMAAGVKLKTSKIDRFRKAFQEIFELEFRTREFVPEIDVDCELVFDDVSEFLIDELERLKPFGAHNPEPVFLARNVKVAAPKIVGENHRRMLLSQPEGQTDKVLNAIHFNIDPETPPEEYLDYVLFKLQWNRWNGSKTAQLLILDAVP
jgi:single-stranded-DNA-specific exonuclease